MNARRRQIKQLRKAVPTACIDFDLSTLEGREAAILSEIRAVRRGERRGVDAKAICDLIVLYDSLLRGWKGKAV